MMKREDVPTGGVAVHRYPPCGEVEGRAHGETARFLGLPYGEAPVGPLRFAAPVSPAPGTLPRRALRFGPTAAQPHRPFTLIPEPTEDGDDVLNLNIYAPAQLPERPLPVLVFMHGGGFFSGCNRSPWFDGQPFVEDGVILVTPSYRLGVEGFMPVQGAPDNRGVLDMILALEWVRDNIADFGGDPEAVTLSGQSAGAGMVAAALAAPKAAGLFQKAILFSGSIGFNGTRTRAEQFSEQFSKAVGRPTSVEALSDLPRDALIAGYETVFAGSRTGDPLGGFVNAMVGGLPLQPFADGTLLPYSVEEAISRGTSDAVPVLVTTTHDEFTFELEKIAQPATDAHVTDALTKMALGPAEQAHYGALYPNHAPLRLVGQAISDFLFRAPMMHMAAIRKRHGAAPTWTADFRWESPVASDAPLRAAHCLDIPFYFSKLDLRSAQLLCGPNPPASLGAAMHAALSNFTKAGSPGWEPWDQSGRTRIWAVPDAGCSDDMNALALFGN